MTLLQRVSPRNVINPFLLELSSLISPIILSIQKLPEFNLMDIHTICGITSLPQPISFLHNLYCHRMSFHEENIS